MNGEPGRGVIVHHSSTSASVPLAAPSVPVLLGVGKSKGMPAGETEVTGPHSVGILPPGTVPTRLPRCPQLHAHLLQDLPAPEVRHLLVQILLLGRKRLASMEGGKGLANFFCKKPGS